MSHSLLKAAFNSLQCADVNVRSTLKIVIGKRMGRWAQLARLASTTQCADWESLHSKEDAREYVNRQRRITVSWNKGKPTGQKPPLKLKEIWAIRVRPAAFYALAGRFRDLELYRPLCFLLHDRRPASDALAVTHVADA
jgi:hypothetical protein